MKNTFEFLYQHARTESLQRDLLDVFLGENWKDTIQKNQPVEITLHDEEARRKFRFVEPSDIDEHGVLTVKSEGTYGRKSNEALIEKLFEDLDIIATSIERLDRGLWKVTTHVEIKPTVHKGSFGVSVNKGVFLVEKSHYDIEQHSINIWQDEENPADLSVLKNYLNLLEDIHITHIDNSKIVFKTHKDALKFSELYIHEKIRPSIPMITDEKEFWNNIREESKRIWDEFFQKDK